MSTLFPLPSSYLPDPPFKFNPDSLTDDDIASHLASLVSRCDASITNATLSGRQPSPPSPMDPFSQHQARFEAARTFDEADDRVFCPALLTDAVATKRFEAARYFDEDDDLEFCPELAHDAELDSRAESVSTDRAVLRPLPLPYEREEDLDHVAYWLEGVGDRDEKSVVAADARARAHVPRWRRKGSDGVTAVGWTYVWWDRRDRRRRSSPASDSSRPSD
ncbi:hypothetical protein MMC13_000949 [Lambiella insularis]|nr:hypothetical protein [Lambiella insularis]